jgi:hypothetical protein
MVDRKVINPFNNLAILIDDSWDKREDDGTEDFGLFAALVDFAGNLDLAPFFILVVFFREAVFGIFVLTWLPPFRR